jgi:hypothetical protein
LDSELPVYSGTTVTCGLGSQAKQYSKLCRRNYSRCGSRTATAVSHGLRAIHQAAGAEVSAPAMLMAVCRSVQR